MTFVLFSTEKKKNLRAINEKGEFFSQLLIYWRGWREETWEQWNWYIERFLTSPYPWKKGALFGVINYTVNSHFALNGLKLSTSEHTCECYANHASEENGEPLFRLWWRREVCANNRKCVLICPARSVPLYCSPEAFHFIRDRWSTNVHLKRFIEWGGSLSREESASSSHPCHGVVRSNTHAEAELSDCRVFIWIFYPWHKKLGNLSPYP